RGGTPVSALEGGLLRRFQRQAHHHLSDLPRLHELARVARGNATSPSAPALTLCHLLVLHRTLLFDLEGRRAIHFLGARWGILKQVCRGSPRRRRLEASCRGSKHSENGNLQRDFSAVTASACALRD